MQVSKQYLNRPLRRLLEDGQVAAASGRALEARLTGAQRRRLAAVFQAAGAEAEAGWRRVMALLAAGAGA